MAGCADADAGGVSRGATDAVEAPAQAVKGIEAVQDVEEAVGARGAGQQLPTTSKAQEGVVVAAAQDGSVAAAQEADAADAAVQGADAVPLFFSSVSMTRFKDADAASTAAGATLSRLSICFCNTPTMHRLSSL
jgi:hypothetical protein